MISNLSIWDNLVVLLYFSIALLIGLYTAAKTRGKGAEQYFLAGKNVGWIAIGMSLFATNISSEHLVGLAGAGSSNGFIVGQFEWLAIFILFLLGWVFAPIFIRSNVYTMPEFLGKRFGNKSRIYLTSVSIVSYLFTKIAVTILAGGFLLSEVLGWDMFTAVVLIVLLTGLYTVIGGLSSVINTQIFQTVVLIFGALFLTLFGIKEIGGLSALTAKLPLDYFKMFKPFSDPDFPWTGILFGAPILGIWYWCTDQYIVQRILSAKGISAARKGTALAAGLKFFPIFLLIIPGLIAAILYPEVKGDEAYTLLLSGTLLPVGIKGIVISGLFAAIMSSLASAFNSSATLISIDLVKPYKKNITDQELVLVGRLATVLIVFLTIMIVPLLRVINTNIYIYLQNLQAYISPPIASVFLIGIFWKGATSKGAFYALAIGGFLGLIRVISTLLDPSNSSNIFGLNYFVNINFLHFAVLLFLVSTFILVTVSISDRKALAVTGIQPSFKLKSASSKFVLKRMQLKKRKVNKKMDVSSN